MFKIMLFCFGIAIKIIYLVASIMDSDFKKRINERNMIILIKTKNGRKAMQYALEYGHIYTRGKDHPDPDISITFSSATRAYLMVLKPTPKLLIKSFMNAISKGKLKIEFNAEALVWFATTLYQLMNVVLNRSKTKNVYPGDTGPKLKLVK